MTLLYTSARFLEHHTGNHPECAARLEHILKHLQATGLWDQCTHTEWLPAELERIESIHDPAMIHRLEQLAQTGGGRADPDTVISPASFDVARLAAGAVCDATRRVISGEERHALCLVRPPGHHALRGTAMGFCLFNNIALAAQTAIDLGLERILIIDWDVHHGNGTQAIFYEDPSVAFFSVHRWPFYPGTGDSDETGTGPVLATTRNLPLEFGVSQRQYQGLVLRDLEDFAARIRPQLVLVSAGFDAHRSDPIGSLGLEVEDFQWLTNSAVEIANSYAEGRLVSTLEGGYNPPVLAECVATHLDSLLSRPQEETPEV